MSESRTGAVSPPLSPAKVEATIKKLLKRGQSKNISTAREVRQLRESMDKHLKGVPKEEWSESACELESLLDTLSKKFSTDQGDQLTGDVEGAEDKNFFEADAWAPLKIPTNRRIQTLCVMLANFFTGLPLFIALAVYLSLCFWTLPFMAVYYLYIFAFPPQHPLPSNRAWATWSFWTYYRDYFPVRLVIPTKVREAISKEKNYLFCAHPHGVHSFGAIVNFGTEANGISEKLPGLRIHLQTLSIQFYIPFWRELSIAMGSGDASKKTLMKTLTKRPGECACLVVGGAAESLLAKPKTAELTLRKRKGFVKIALRSGAHLVPVFSFGENDVYRNLAEGRPKLQKFMAKVQKTLGFALPLIGGRGVFNYNFGLMPHRRPIVTVVGMPIEVTKIEEPTKEDVDALHARYVAALQALYDEHAEVFAAARKSELHLN